MFERVYADTPRILAIQDVYLRASLEDSPTLREFYEELLGLHPVEPPHPDALSFRGVDAAGPRLIVALTAESPPPPVRRAVLVQVGCLHAFSEACRDRKLAYEVQRGWSFYDRRLFVEDPAGYRVEVIAYHTF